MLASQKEMWNYCAELQKKYLELRKRYEFLLRVYRELCRTKDPDTDARSVSASEGGDSGVQLLSGRMVVGRKGEWGCRQSRLSEISFPRSRRSRRRSRASGRAGVLTMRVTVGHCKSGVFVCK